MGISILSLQASIGHEIYAAIEALDHEFPGEWRLSLIEAQSNDCWELKLSTPDGTRLPVRNLGPELHSVEGIQRTLREVRDSAQAA